MLARTPVTPNMVSIAGGAMVVATAILYARVGTMPAIAAGFVLHLLWHVVDGADGDLARMTGRASPIGELVDGLCDYLSHIVLYVMLAATLDDRLGAMAWVLAVSAGVSRMVQSNFAESTRRSYQWWAYGVPWLQQEKAVPTGFGSSLGRLYMAASRLLTGPTATINTLVASAEHDPAERQRIARLAREFGRSSLVVPAILGANPRTIILGLAMLATGAPTAFFLIEATLLNAVLVFGILRQASNCRKLVAVIGRGRD